MVEVFCLICAGIKDIDLFKTAVKPPHDKPYDIMDIENPNPVPRQRYAPLVRYKNYSNTDMGIGVCYSCNIVINQLKLKYLEEGLIKEE